VAEEEDAEVVFTKEDTILFEILKRKQIAVCDGDKKSVSEEASISFFL
jgi:hypothetical protein